jgi:putative nucleotidyltransferase with HDIG domain
MTSLGEQPGPHQDLWYVDSTDSALQQDAYQRLLQQVGLSARLSPFPDSASRLLAAASDPDFSLGELQRIIETDPALVARILKLVNSAAFFLSQSCRSVSQAILLLGGRSLVELAATMAVLNMWPDPSPMSREIRRHSAVVALVVQRVSERLGISSPSMTTAALLHDLGRLVLLRAHPETYVSLVRSCDPLRLHRREREVFGYDHGVLGGVLLRSYGIPEPIPLWVARHHQLERPADDLIGEQITWLIRLADEFDQAVSSGMSIAACAMTLLVESRAAAELDLHSTSWPRAQQAMVRGYEDAMSLCRVGL